MDNSQFNIIEESLKNYFDSSRGSVFFKPDISNNIEDIEFEQLDGWTISNLLVSRIQVAMANYFSPLELVEVFILEQEEGSKSISVNLIIKLKKEGESITPREFNITLKR